MTHASGQKIIGALLELKKKNFTQMCRQGKRER